MSSTANIPIPNQSGIKLVHVVVVSLSLVLTLIAWQFSKSQVEKQILQRFETARNNVGDLIHDRMGKYEDALWGGVAAVESHGGDITYEEWHGYAKSLRIDEKYPGINGIGLIHFHTEQTLDSYLSKQRVLRPDFDIFPVHDQSIFMPITFIEPHGMNAAAIGLDVAHERNRRQAAELSAATGTAQITGPITLVQDTGQTAGFLFYAPFYRGGRPETSTARKDLIVGTVYAPFVVHKLVSGLLAKEYRNVRFSISDGETVIYDEHDALDASNDTNPMFTDEIALDLYGRNWVIDVRTNLAFRAENSQTQSTFILVGGLVIETLIIALLVMMSRANNSAIAYADRVTADLKAETRQLDLTNRDLGLKNEELEQFAYVASHDLKTPIRGINGLAEMIEEDLEPYFASPDANPDVRQNLESIRTRVLRMNQLTNGIMDFGQINAETQTNHPLELSDVFKDLAFDLNLPESQLQLTGDVTSVAVDTVNLRRVLENLIGNAVKYHDGARSVEIVVTTKKVNGRCKFAVSDNGPGIEAKFHDRIFKIFQTLKTGSMTESTGIGLAIVRKAIERQGGAIQVHSTFGQGATFTFDWPMAAKSDALTIQNKAA